MVLLFFGLVCAACAIEMMVQDAVWSASTKAIAAGHTRMGASLNSAGDGLGKATSILTILLVGHGALYIQVAQIIGNMAGAFIGVFIGAQLSLFLDRTFAGYHRHPKHNPLSTFGFDKPLLRQLNKAPASAAA